MFSRLSLWPRSWTVSQHEAPYLTHWSTMCEATAAVCIEMIGLFSGDFIIRVATVGCFNESMCQWVGIPLNGFQTCKWQERPLMWFTVLFIVLVQNFLKYSSYVFFPTQLSVKCIHCVCKYISMDSSDKVHITELSIPGRVVTLQGGICYIFFMARIAWRLDWK